MKIIRKNSQIIIENYEQNEKLERALSVFDYLKKKFVYSAFFKKENSIVIPANFDIEPFLNKGDEVVDEYKPIKNRKIKLSLKSSLKEEQKDLFSSLMKSSNTQKFLCGKTGIGKTFVTFSYIEAKKDLPLLLVYGEKVMENWIKEIEKHTNIEKDEIYIISGRDSINKIMNMEKNEISKYKFIIAIHRTLKILLDENPASVNKLFLKLAVGLKIVDEAHNEWKNTINLDLLTNVKESLYITSTPYKNDSNENRLYQSIFGLIEKVGLNKKYEEKYHNVCIIKFNSGASFKEIKTMSTFQYPFVAQRYTDYLMTDKVYNNHLLKILLIILKKSRKNKSKTAFIFNKRSLIDKVAADFKKILQDNNIEMSVGIFAAGSGREVLNSDIILTTDKSFQDSIDVDALDVVVTTVPATGQGRVEQMIGRLRKIKGKEVIFYDIVDVSIPDCRKQLVTRLQIYNKLCKDIRTVEIN